MSQMPEGAAGPRTFMLFTAFWVVLCVGSIVGALTTTAAFPKALLVLLAGTSFVVAAISIYALMKRRSTAGR